MALIACPECGKEKVSDTALSCPQCGYNIAVYTKKEEKRKKTEQHKKTWKLASLIVVVIAIIIVIIGIYSKNKAEQRESDIRAASRRISSIMDSLEVIDGYLEEGNYVYGSVSSDVAINYITQNLDYIETYITEINGYYGKGDMEICHEIDQYVNENTQYDSWHDFSSALMSVYFIEETNAQSADKLVKDTGYSSTEEWIESIKKE